MAWTPEYDPYYRPRRASPTLLIFAVLTGVAVGVGLLYYVNDGFNFRQTPANDPAATPRPAEPRSGFDAEETEAIRVFKDSKASVVNVDTVQLVRRFDLGVQQQQTGTGSGFVWDDDGRIVTNYHVVAVALQNRGLLRVVFSDHTASDAVIVGTAPDYDLAVLKASNPPRRIKPIRVGTSKDLEVGQKVFAIGNPFGLSLTMTKGIISALDREIASPGDRPISGAIQTDAAVNPGNSGGPLLDKDGRLIGVNAAITSPSGGNVGIGFAIPVDTVNDIVPKLIAGKLLRPDAGLKLVDQIVLLRNGIRGGAMISEVLPGGPADQAGLKGLVSKGPNNADPGDLIVAIDGDPLASNVDYVRAIAKKNVGDTVKFKIKRGEKVMTVDVTLRGI